VSLSGRYEMFSSIVLGGLGLYLDEQLTYMHVGEVLLCERWCLRVCCDVYKGKRNKE
jgi:hypothetical protein